MSAAGLPKFEAARRLRLSPSSDAVFSGAGRAILLRGKDPFVLDDREMRALVVGWLAYERARRPDAFEALLAPLTSETDETASA